MTVVSARNRLVRSTFASTAFAVSVSFGPTTAAFPAPLVIFIRVVGCANPFRAPIARR
jgi:hypothetical protein